MVTGKLEALQIRMRQKLWGALGGLFLPQPNPVNGWFIPDRKRQTGAIQLNISQRNRLGTLQGLLNVSAE
jgi:hypothetical protein